MRCSVPNCTNDSKVTRKNHEVTYHLFPKEPAIRTAWLEALGSEDLALKERSVICSEHFCNEDLYLTKSGMKKVRSGAVPVIIQNSAEDLDAPAAFRVCRICLAMDTRLFDIRQDNLDQYYLQITGVFVDDDSLPRRVCWECANRLRSAACLREKALRAQTTLLEVICTNKYLTLRDIKTINRIENGLASNLVLFECTDASLQIRDNETIHSEANDYETDFDYDMKEPIEVKDEGNEIFVDEYIVFESDDEKTLSVLSRCEKKIKKGKVKKAKEKKKSEVKRNEVENPETTMDKYKTSDIKRRRPNDGLDESLFTISALTYEEQIAEVEKRQESNAYKNAMYKCTTCYRGFQIKDRYEAHIVRHSEKCGMYECFICKTRLKAARALRKHLTSQHSEQFSCKGCLFVTRNRGVAREHQKWHAGTKYQCPHCAMEFDKLTTYMGHIRIKHASDWVCALCGYTFVSQKGVEVHKRKKHRMIDDNTPLEGPTCNVCEVQFADEEAHGRHLKLSSRHMTESDPNRLRNDSQCVKSERNGRVMRRIERRPLIHPRKDTPCETPRAVTCEQCGVQLRDLRLYAQHFRRAHPDKNRTKYPAMKTPAMCELCGRIFQSMALLKDHMWVHTGEKRFKCARCPKSFTQKSNLVFHERAHSEARPSFPCPLCGKHFAFHNNRRRHMFIHTGLKPFKCTSCGKCFTTAGEQRAHSDHVHLKKPWPRRARKDMCEEKCAEP